MADNLADIIARLEAATRHDWKLNAEICEYFEVQSTVFHEAQAVTKSIDAAVALAARVLPGWRWEISTYRNGSAAAFIVENDDYGAKYFSPREGRPPAIALCVAILKAVAAKGTPHGR